MNTLPLAEKISRISEPLNWTEEKKILFIGATREICHFHYQHSPDIRYLYDKHQFKIDSLVDEESLSSLPALHVTAMKSFLITSLPHDSAVLKLTSSGTRGQKTQIWFDQASLDRVQAMLDVYLDQEGFVTTKPCNYLVFNYDPDQAGDLGIAYTEKNQLRFAPVKQVFYAIRKNSQSQWNFEKEEALKYLSQFAEQDIPVRIFGMPAFIFEFLEYLKSLNTKFQFPKESWILTGGGWKAAEEKRISRSEFRRLCFEAFGIDVALQRDAFGMAEHCAPYFECSHHRLHIPVFNRILIRDPVTYRVLPHGQVGLMELLTPFNAMMPTAAILSTDYGRIHADDCACGANAPSFEIIGRAGISKHRGCALTAQEIVRRQ